MSKDNSNIKRNSSIFYFDIFSDGEMYLVCALEYENKKNIYKNSKNKKKIEGTKISTKNQFLKSFLFYSKTKKTITI